MCPTGRLGNPVAGEQLVEPGIAVGMDVAASAPLLPAFRRGPPLAGWTAPADHFGFEQVDHRLGESAVIAFADAANTDASLSQPFSAADRTAIKVLVQYFLESRR